MLIKLERCFNKFSDIIGRIAATLLILMLINVFYDAIMRYLFKSGHIALQEIEWHLFSIVFLIGIAYTLKEDAHVRVDIIYDHLNTKTRSLINIFGAFILLIPLSWLIITGSLEFVREAYEFKEISGDPGGLTHRYLIKAIIPFSFVLILVSAVGFVLHNINIFLGAGAQDKP